MDYVKFARAVLKSSKARVMGLLNSTFAMVWIQNKEHTWWNVINQMPIETLESVELELLGFQDGTYTVEWWDTYTGNIIKRETLQAVGGKISLLIETLDKDVAIKLTIDK